MPNEHATEQEKRPEERRVTVTIHSQDYLTNNVLLSRIPDQIRAVNMACSGVSDLRPLATLSQLRTLNLTGCSLVSDLSPLAGLTQLRTLYMPLCSGVSDLRPLAGLTKLTILDLNLFDTLPAKAREILPSASGLT